MKKITVIDFFCGAGGFSEGFRQQGFNIVAGIDKWQPAVSTFNHNYKVKCKAQDILTLSEDMISIDNLPNTDVIIGSPPCVSFSNSNKSGNADKSLGVKLTEAFLKIVTIKKFQPNSQLKAWYMENVPNSLKFLKSQYSFKDLGLTDWARKLNLNPVDISIILEGNSFILNSAEYGAVQSRKRVITGENIELGVYRKPIHTHFLKEKDRDKNLSPAVTLKEIKSKMPCPLCKKSSRSLYDPVYPEIKILLRKLTDHFYDSGLYECQWKNSFFMKRNHPFMGRMSFPENESNPSRTITATNIGTSRESIIYSSEASRYGDGEYRTPTIREMATIMGFPYTYQFKANGVNSKARLVGNAVCVSVSRAIAKQLRSELGMPELKKSKVEIVQSLEEIHNLNTFCLKQFDNPPKKKTGSRFRMHPFKDGNMTVTLSNYNLTTKNNAQNKWYTSVQFGNGRGYPSDNYKSNYYKKLESIILNQEKGNLFLKIINNGFSSSVAKGETLQRIYENNSMNQQYKNPIILIEELSEIIEKLQVEELLFRQNEIKIFKHKNSVPMKQLFALYAINRISSIANKN